VRILTKQLGWLLGNTQLSFCLARVDSDVLHHKPSGIG
jgi:hypothetical protein